MVVVLMRGRGQGCMVSLGCCYVEMVSRSETWKMR